MKTFHCDVCNGPLFFENSRCTRCDLAVGYFPDRNEMATLKGKRHRSCHNYEVEQICNWMIPAEDPDEYCLSCRLTRTIPSLETPGHRALWHRLEIAKRRLIYSLLDLGLPVIGKTMDPEQGLAFEFLADVPGPDGKPVMTGHADGVITLNIAEADDSERERRRNQLREPYRTLLGHFRHETGHYYWNLLIRDSDRLADFRRVFGDERADYAQSMQRHYAEGPPEDWQTHFVSAYASSHPWEDWAETWAHYLHMTDSLDTAAALGIALRPEPRKSPRTVPERNLAGFGDLASSWATLTCALNCLNRSMGLQDAYPFVLPEPALAKLRYVHELVNGNEPRLRMTDRGSTDTAVRTQNQPVAANG